MATNKKQLTIHKANEIIRGVNDYSLYGKRCMNAIYYIYQYNFNRDIKISKLDYLDIPFSFLRKMMGLEKVESYIAIIESSLKELEKTIELNHFYHPIEKIEYQWYTDRFLNKAGWFTKNNKKYARVEISKLAKYLIEKQSNFTKLDLSHYLNKLRTKYAMKLYEYLKSFGTFRYLDISQQHMMKLFGFEPEHKTYKHYAKLKTLLERQLKEIAKKTDLKQVKLIVSKTLSKEKTFRIIINPKSERDINKIKAKNQLDNMLNNLIKRF